MTDLASFDIEAAALQRMAHHKQHTVETYREILNHKLRDMANAGEQAIDYCRKLMREGADVSDELKEMECTANGLLLVALLLKRETE